MGTRLFDYEKAERSAGWLRELAGEHHPETLEYGISSFVYRTVNPFDAHKLFEFFSTAENFRGVLRSKGFFWIAADHRIAYEWGQAGGVSSVSPSGLWWAAVPRERREELGGEATPEWDQRFGDRLQQLVFIGQDLDETKLRDRLDACLLDPALAGAASSDWEELTNPFPPLELGESDRSVLLGATE